MQAQGAALWALFEAEKVFVSDDLKLILKANRYDDLYSLINFSDGDKQKCLDFMQHTLHKLPHMKKNEDLMESYYGIFKDSPEQFTFLGGVEKTLKRIVTMAKQMVEKPPPSTAGGGSANSQLAKSTKPTSASSPPDATENMTDKIVAHKKTLDDNVNSYFKKSYPDAQLSVSSTVAQDNLGSFVASLPCPYQSCSKIHKIMMNKTRWNTSNYYAHVKNHYQIKKTDPAKNKPEKGKTLLQQYLTPESNQAQESGSSDNVSNQQLKRKSVQEEENGQEQQEDNGQDEGNNGKSKRKAIINSEDENDDDEKADDNGKAGDEKKEDGDETFSSGEEKIDLE